jgi:two-component system cell cycle sensor histidine kinase/response regulator CckA
MGTVDDRVVTRIRGSVELRRRAEEIVDHDPPRAVPMDARDAMHELRVHEIELVMQNEELTRNADELARARDAYRAMYDDAPVGYLTLDQRGVVLEGNHVAATLLGMPRHALAHMALSSLMDQANGDAFYLHLREVAELGGHRRCDLVMRTTDGRELHVRLDTVAAAAATARLFRTTLVDTTDQHRVEQEIRRLNADLERRVQERTSELEATHTRLLEARKMEALGRVASEIAHDFNNLLTVIRLQLGLLRRQAERDNRSDDGLAEAILATASAGALIAKLLAFARRDATGGATCAPAIVLAAAVSLLRQLVNDEVDLVTHADPDLGWIDMDGTAFEQIITNLVVNASDAIVGRGRIDVELTGGGPDPAVAADDPRARRHVVLTVRDTGCGMDAETASHACEPFFTTKGRSRGTGFGLAIVYGAVTAAGGQLALHTRPGAGTTVTIVLPVTDASPRRHPPVDDDEWPGGDETMLVVDDDDEVRRATARVLAAAGYRVVAVATGEEALAALVAQPGIAAVVSDIVMPGMSGVDLARAIGTLHPDLPLVLISGSVFEENIAAEWRLVRKPFTPVGLLQAIRDALEQGTS